MATIYRCDACKKLFDNKDSLRQLRLPRMRNMHAFSEETDGISREVCVSCARFISDTYDKLTKAADEHRPANQVS